MKIEEDKTKPKGGKWEPLEYLPPPCNPVNGEVLLQGELLPQGEEAPLREEVPQSCRRVTRSRVREEKEEGKLFPLREVPLGGPQGGIGFVNVPLNLAEVRSFKKEMKALLEDPLGLAEQFDQFLGPNVYTWEEMRSIMSILFTPEEQQMIRAAGMRIWETENQEGVPSDQKMPLQNPQWDQNQPQGRQNMADFRNLILRGIKEAAPRGQNAARAFDSQQGKDETPTEWLERLRKTMQQFSGIDPSGPVGQTVLKVNFVTHSWPDIQKKLEKLEDWQGACRNY